MGVRGDKQGRGDGWGLGYRGWETIYLDYK